MKPSLLLLLAALLAPAAETTNMLRVVNGQVYDIAALNRWYIDAGQGRAPQRPLQKWAKLRFASRTKAPAGNGWILEKVRLVESAGVVADYVFVTNATPAFSGGDLCMDTGRLISISSGGRSLTYPVWDCGIAITNPVAISNILKRGGVISR